jgi:hypothetical protein
MSKPDFYYYNESEWDRLGCGPLPESRKRPEPLSKEASPFMLSFGALKTTLYYMHATKTSQLSPLFQEISL